MVSTMKAVERAERSFKLEEAVMIDSNISGDMVKNLQGEVQEEGNREEGGGKENSCTRTRAKGTIGGVHL